MSSYVHVISMNLSVKVLSILSQPTSLSVCLSVCLSVFVNFDLDIATAHPFSKDIVKRSSEETSDAAEKDSQVPKSDYTNRRSSKVCAFGL